MFGTLLQKIPEFFSIRFLFGSYLPMVIFLTINALLGWLAFWCVQEWVAAYLKLKEGLLQTMLATSAALAIAVLAMIFNGMVVFVRRTLEGRSWLIRPAFRRRLTRNRSAA